MPSATDGEESFVDVSPWDPSVDAGAPAEVGSSDVGSAGVASSGFGPAGVGPSDGRPLLGVVPRDNVAETEPAVTNGQARSEQSGVAADIAATVEREPVGPPASAGPGLLRRASLPAQNPTDHHKADTA